MSVTLPNGYTIHRVNAPHYVNGVEVGYLTDKVDKVIVVTDDGDADALVDRTAEAIYQAIAVSKQVQGAGGIEIIQGPFPKAPLLPGSSDPRLF